MAVAEGLNFRLPSRRSRSSCLEQDGGSGQLPSEQQSARLDHSSAQEQLKCVRKGYYGG